MKGEMNGWQTMQSNRAADDATGGCGGRQCKAIGQQTMQQERGVDNARQSGDE